MTCQKVVGSLDRFTATDLASTTRRAIEAHLARCAQCSSYAAEYSALRRLTNGTLYFGSNEQLALKEKKSIMAAILRAERRDN